jgi:condensin-2 complex subunit H2
LHELGGTVDLGEVVDDGMETEEAVKPNFAKAALVLHNSSHIYSRKVEYLYSLVNQTLDSLLAVSSQKKASRGRTIDPEIEDFRDFDPHQDFLLLDDVLPTDKSDDCRHINLAPTATGLEVSRRFSLASHGTATPHGHLSMRTQNLSSSTLGKSFHTLSVSKALNQISTSSTAVLRLMDGQCDLDPSGRLLVPGCQNTSPLVQDPPATVGAPLGESDYAAGGDFQGDHDDYDNDGPGFAMADDDDGDMHEGVNAGADRKRVTFAPENTTKPTAAVPERPDPWALLDPHTLDQRKLRPFRLGKTLRLPPGIDDLPSDGVTGARTRKWNVPSIKATMVETVNPKFFAAESFHNLSRKRRHDGDDEDEDTTDADTGDGLPNLPLKGLLYGNEFAYLAREHAERKATERRQMRRLQKQWERTNGPSPTGEVAYAGFDDDEDDYGPGFAFAGDDDNDGEAGGSPIIETNTGLQAVEEVYLSRHDDGTFRLEWKNQTSPIFAHTICSVPQQIQTLWRILVPLKRFAELTSTSLLGEPRSTLRRLS